MTATLHPRRLAAPTRHRLAAAVTDLVIVAIPPLAVALLASERFRLLDPTAEPVRVRPADQAALDQLLAGFHRQTEWNGWLHVIDGPGLAGIAAALVATVLVTQVLFPALGDGRSPGKGALGLRVVAATGRAATVRQHLRRTAVAPFDLLVWPLVVVARRLAGQSGTSPARLGDRLAGTRVTRIPRNWVVAADRVGPQRNNPDLGSAPAVDPDPVPVERPVTITLAKPGPVVEPCSSIELNIGELVVGDAAIGPAPGNLAEGPNSRASSAATDGDPSPVISLAAKPAPPLFPVRRLDGSATRSPRSRAGATRADMTPGRWSATLDAGWLGSPLGDLEGLVPPAAQSDQRSDPPA